eukprot:TRINITY_DN2044_c0_g1_i4.p1 TRINITY_DN2044_c0_g1~~TRINITY_DN2044_c0_g1_i4.p1  ORF type:complete len:312 (+),score=63.67 TRINITY_DN2044_c0_g1_i4:772-1707(+)
MGECTHRPAIGTKAGRMARGLDDLYKWKQVREAKLAKLREEKEMQELVELERQRHRPPLRPGGQQKSQSAEKLAVKLSRQHSMVRYLEESPVVEKKDSFEAPPKQVFLRLHTQTDQSPPPPTFGREAKGILREMAQNLNRIQCQNLITDIPASIRSKGHRTPSSSQASMLSLSVLERSEVWADARRAKVAEKVALKEASALEGCTFKPQVRRLATPERPESLNRRPGEKVGSYSKLAAIRRGSSMRTTPQKDDRSSRSNIFSLTPTPLPPERPHVNPSPSGWSSYNPPNKKPKDVFRISDILATSNYSSLH